MWLSHLSVNPIFVGRTTPGQFPKARLEPDPPIRYSRLHCQIQRLR